MPTLTSSNRPQKAVSSTSYLSGATSTPGLYTYEFSRKYTQASSRIMSFTFDGLPTSNITINSIVIKQESIELTGTRSRGSVNQQLLSIGGVSHYGGGNTWTVSDSQYWTEDLANSQVTVKIDSFSFQGNNYTSGANDTCSVGTYNTFSATLTYTYNGSTLTTPTLSISSTHAKAGASVSLSWTASAPSGSDGNKVSGYEIYQNGSYIGETSAINRTSSVSLTNAGVSARFQVKAISDVAGFDSSLSNSVYLYSYGEAPTSVAATLYTEANTKAATTITVGANYDGTKIAFGLNATEPTYNNVAEVGVYKKGATAPIQTYTLNLTACYPLSESYTEGIYTLHVKYDSGDVITSNEVEIKKLTAPAAIAFTNQPAAKSVYASNVGYTWDIVSGATSYNIYDGGVVSSAMASSYTHSITNTALASPFYIEVAAVASAPYGGESTSTKTKSNTAYRADSIKNLAATQTPEKVVGGVPSVFNKATFSWTYTPSTITVDGLILTVGGQLVKGTLLLSYNNGAPLSIPFTIENGQTSYTDTTVANYTQGAIAYTLTFEDEYGQKSQTFAFEELQKLEAPIVKITSITEGADAAPVKNANLNVEITAAAATASTSDLRYNVVIIWGGEEAKVVSAQSFGNAIPSTVLVGFNLKTYAANLSKLWAALKGTTSTLPISKPTISFRLEVYDKNLPEAVGTSQNSCVFNFATAPSSVGSLTVSNATKPTLAYASSADTLSFGGITPTHTDYWGDATTNFLTYKLVRNESVSVVPETAANGVFTHSATLPEITADTTYTYRFTLTKKYQEQEYTQSWSKTFPVKRWVSPTIMLTNFEWKTQEDGTALMGRVFSQDDRWGGATDGTENIATIKITLYYVGGSLAYNAPLIAPTRNYINGKNYYDFQLQAMQVVSDVQIYAQVVITSSSGQIYTITTPVVLVKEQGIPFAIRKFGIGTNIPDDFNPTTADPALSAIGNSGTDTVAAFTNGTNRSTTQILLQNDKGGPADTGKAYLSLNKNGTEWALSIFFE